MQKCLYCDKDLYRDHTQPPHYFCSVECVCYSGCYSINYGMDLEKLKELINNKGENAH